MKNSFSINIIFLVLTIIGVALMPRLSMQLRPDYQGESIYVSFNWSNLSAEVVEKEVTSVLEGVLVSIKGVKEVSSTSSNGSGRISLEFKKGIDMDAARYEVSSLIRNVYQKLPAGVSQPEVSYKSDDDEDNSVLLVYNINGEGSNYQIQNYTKENIASVIGQISDVSNVEVSGAMPLQWEVTYNTNRMLAVNLTAQDLTKSIQSYLETKELGAAINTHGESIFLRFKGQPTDSIKWNEIIVANDSNRIIHLTDLASVVQKEKKPTSYFRVNGLNTIYMVVYSAKGANQVALAKQVKEKIAELQPTFPANFSLMLNHDASKEIEQEISKITSRSLMAIAILLLFVLAISRRWRYLLIILVSLIANLSIACIFYYMLGVEIHLYSLAGITVSLGIVIDNTIVMVDHIRHHGNKKAFLAILAATLTTIGSLAVIFFLKEEQKLNLMDFAWVIIINLSISLFIALWFIPAIMDRFPLDGKSASAGQKVTMYAHKARSYRWSVRYNQFVEFAKRWKWAFIIALIWGFGLPTFLLPDEIKIDEEKGEQPNWYTDLYNATFGNSTYVNDIKPWTDKILGGSLHYFSSYLEGSSMDWDNQETRLNVRMTMPDGATIEQMNKVFLEWENYLVSFPEVKRFVSRIYSIDNASFEISFTKEAENGIFPYVLKQKLESKAVDTGGVDTSIYGVGKGFSNSLGGDYLGCQIQLSGYNYDKLVDIARAVKDTLLKNPRIQEAYVQTGSGWMRKPKYEFVSRLNSQMLAANSSSIQNVYNNLLFYSPQDAVAGIYFDGKNSSNIVVKEDNKTFNIWNFKNNLLRANGDFLRMNQVGEIAKERTGSFIRKKDQQYFINVEYNFIGPWALSNRILERTIKNTKKNLPLGYSVKKGNDYSWWNMKEKTQYYLLILVIAIIYFICAILLESLIQPLAVIATIPISFIGVFLTFAIFQLRFDQGGYASMILLCGITVNSALYIINDYNNNRRENNRKSKMQHYLKAFNHKIIPILLTVLSTILGMVPFLLGGQDDGFWFSLASGAIGGLVFSVLAIAMFLPLFMRTVNSEQ